MLDADYLIGLGTLDERMLILVDIDRLMSSAEMGLIEKLAAKDVDRNNVPVFPEKLGCNAGARRAGLASQTGGLQRRSAPKSDMANGACYLLPHP